MNTSYYGINEPSVADNRVTVRVVCPACGRIEWRTMPEEYLREQLVDTGDGTWAGHEWCYSCAALDMLDEPEGAPA